MKISFLEYFRSLFFFLRDVYQGRRLLFHLVKDDFKKRYVQNYLGILWVFIQPSVTILILWLVFQVGFKSAPVKDFPFILWMITGILPWFFLAEAIQTSTDSIIANSYLVKKIVFKVSLLPVVKIFSAVIIHLFFIAVIFAMFIIHGYTPSLFWLQIFYYLFASLLLLLGIAWITSSVVIFFPDLRQLVAMVIQFGFWLTPIFWSLSILPEKYQWLFQLNPAYYIVQGYRDSLIDKVWFWQKPYLTLSFGIVTFFLFSFGGIVFRKLKPHFADVL